MPTHEISVTISRVHIFQENPRSETLADDSLDRVVRLQVEADSPKMAQAKIEAAIKRLR